MSNSLCRHATVTTIVQMREKGPDSVTGVARCRGANVPACFRSEWSGFQPAVPMKGSQPGLQGSMTQQLPSRSQTYIGVLEGGCLGRRRLVLHTMPPDSRCEQQSCEIVFETADAFIFSYVSMWMCFDPLVSSPRAIGGTIEVTQIGCDRHW